MDTKQKMAIVGSSLIVTGVGLGLVGAALLVPAAFEWTARLVEKGADGFSAKVERASKTVGAVAGSAAWLPDIHHYRQSASRPMLAVRVVGHTARKWQNSVLQPTILRELRFRRSPVAG